MAAHADQGDAPQGVVGPAVAAAIQSVAVGAARGRRDGSGETPHRCAKAASERSRWGVSPAVTRSWPAVSIPTPASATRVGAAALTSAWELAVELVELALELLPAAGQGP
jgi:hypothetical protein